MWNYYWPSYTYCRGQYCFSLLHLSSSSSVVICSTPWQRICNVTYQGQQAACQWCYVPLGWHLVIVHSFLVVYYLFALCLKNTVHLTFDHNFGKCRLIFKILSLADSQGMSMWLLDEVFHLTLTVLLLNLMKLKNLK